MTVTTAATYTVTISGGGTGATGSGYYTAIKQGCRSAAAQPIKKAAVRNSFYSGRCFFSSEKV